MPRPACSFPIDNTELVFMTILSSAQLTEASTLLHTGIPFQSMILSLSLLASLFSCHLKHTGYFIICTVFFENNEIPLNGQEQIYHEE